MMAAAAPKVAVFDRDDDDAWGGLLNLIPTRMHYAEEEDGQSKKKAKKAKAKAAKAAKSATPADNADPDTTMNDAVAEPTQSEKEEEKPIKAQEEKPAEAPKEKPAKSEKETPVKPEKEKPTKSPKEKLAKPEKEPPKRDWELAALNSTGSETPTKADEQTPGPKKKKQRIETPSTDIKLARQLIGEAEEAVKRAEKFGSDSPAHADEGKKTAAATPKSVKNHLRKMAHLASAGTPTPTPAASAANPTKQSAPAPAALDTSSRSTTSEPESSTFDAADAAVQPQIPSVATSVSSTAGSSDKPKPIKIPEDTAAFRERFAARLATLRAARRADGTDGKPARSRDELLEQRRYKAAQRKEHKKEIRRLARLEEDAKREEALKANSPSVMSPGDELDENTANFSFGRVSFGDGAQLSHDLSYVLNRSGGKRGPTDPKGQLVKLQGQKRRLAEMDEEKRKEVEEKEDWLTARRRAEGERIRDDEALLKKAVKRKERAKRKSEKEWKERKSAVEVGIKARLKKREENIRKRQDEKKFGKLGKKKGSGGVTKNRKKNRPGFEGKFGGGKK